MDCSARIKLERQKRSWTQEQLAERAKLSTRTVQRIECGSESSAETLRLIAEAFGVPVHALRPPAVRSHFSAPWSGLVKVVTFLAIGVVIVLPFLIPRIAAGWLHWLTWGVLLFCLFLCVSGYSVRSGQLLVHRLGWTTRFDLASLSRFETNPHAMLGSIRLFGNGGLFCFIGYYRNGVLGRYRAFVTDPARAVVLEFGSQKIVVSPDDPQAFVETLREAVTGVCRDAEAAPPNAANGSSA